MHLFRLLVLALISQHCCQVVHARQCVRMLFAQHRLPQPKCLSMHLFRLLVLALIPQHYLPGYSCSSVCQDAPCPTPSPSVLVLVDASLPPARTCPDLSALLARLFMLVSVSGCSLPNTVSLSSECLSMHLFRLLVLALITQHSCQVIHARQCVRMLLAQHRLPQL